MNALIKLLAILCPLGPMHLTVEAADPSAQVKNGIWLGTLKTPNGQELRMVIEVFPKADGTTAAAPSVEKTTGFDRSECSTAFRSSARSVSNASAG